MESQLAMFSGASNAAEDSVNCEANQSSQF